MRSLLVVVVLLALGTHAVGDPPAGGATKYIGPETGVREVLAAFDAKDAAALRALASRDMPDPWTVADLLLGQGREDAAEAFASAAPRRDVERLPAYVAAERARPEAPAARKALGDLLAAISASKAEEALDASERAGERRDSVTWVRLFLGRGFVFRQLRRLEESAAAFREAAAAAERLGWHSRVVQALGERGRSAYDAWDWPGALDAWRRKVNEEERRGATGHEMAEALADLGGVHASLGNYAKALAYHERALKIAEATGDPGDLATLLGNFGAIESRLGNVAKALEYYDRTLVLERQMGDAAGEAWTLESLGEAHAALGDRAKALSALEQSLELRRQMEDPLGEAAALASIGEVYEASGEHTKALESLEHSLGIRESVKDRAGEAATRATIGGVLRALGQHARALESLEKAARASEEIRSDPALLMALSGIARTALEAGDNARAMTAAARGVGLLTHMFGGLAVEQGARARSTVADLFAAGTLAAARASDTSRALFFLESGRAGTLLEALRSHEGLAWAGLPEGLRVEEAVARREETTSAAAYVEALGGEKRDEIQARAAALEAAHEKTLAVEERIQREAKGSASVLDLRTTPMERIEAGLAAGDAVLLYAFCLDEALAMVVTAKAARIVPLGKAGPLEAACAALVAGDETVDPEAALAEVRRLAVTPLALGDDVRRLLVSPSGPLTFVPFAALVRDRTVALVPSATTLDVLRRQGEARGRGVLALGDPDYGKRQDPVAVAVYRGQGGRAGRLPRLAASREEVEAVGDTLLLGADASEGGLAAALSKKGGRWRAVHLACHGLVDLEHPMLSSLALAPDADSDGFLTVAEVFRMPVPADLVVLSACETARGKVYAGEGVVGLTRAFLLAGAPRVISSLWLADDKATRALMTKFYALWNPKDGSKPMGPAEALRAAQDHVRTHEIDVVDDVATKREGHAVTKRVRPWEHPAYWAAWVLWGLPD